MYRRSAIGLSFDFDNGYLTKSPCRDCPGKTRLPACAVKCKILSVIQQCIANSLSSCNVVSEAEEYVVHEQT
jgi:hypothetical protein